MTTVRAEFTGLDLQRGQAGVTKAGVTIVFDRRRYLKSLYRVQSITCHKDKRCILSGNIWLMVYQQQTVLNLFQSVQLNINN